MGDEKTYIPKDLIDYASLREIDSLGDESYLLSRSSALEQVLPNSATVRCERSGSYQGEMVFVIELNGYLWLAHDWYGSCSGCDYFLSDPSGWAEDVLNRFYCFESVVDARTYLNQTMEYGFEEVELKGQANELLDDVIEQEYVE